MGVWCEACRGQEVVAWSFANLLLGLSVLLQGLLVVSIVMASIWGLVWLWIRLGVVLKDDKKS